MSRVLHEEAAIVLHIGEPVIINFHSETPFTAFLAAWA